MTAAASPPTRLRKNVIAEATCRLISSGLVILLVPLIVRFYGVSGFGVWEIITTFSQIAVMFQAAITGTMLWGLSHAYGEEDLKGIERTVGIGFTTNLLQTLLILTICALLGSKLGKWAQVPTEDLGPLLLAVAATALTGFSETMSSAVSATHRMRFTSTLRTGAQILQYVLSIGFLMLGFGMWGLAGALAVNVFVCIIGNRWLMWRFLPSVRVGFCFPVREELKTLGNYFGSLSVGVVSQALRSQLDRVVLAHYATPTWVGYYGIANRLCMLIFEFNRYYYYPLIPASANLQARGDQAGLNNMFTRIMTFTGIATGSMTVIVAGLYQHILLAWIGRVDTGVIKLLFLLIIPGFLQVILTGPASAVCRGIGRAKLESIYLAISLVINLVLTVFLVLEIGFLGTVIASGVATVISIIVFSFLLHTRTPLPVAASLRTIRNAVAVCVSVALMQFLTYCLPFHSGRIVN
jgi:O-antigen/teichoic acid export membrane protein